MSDRIMIFLDEPSFEVEAEGIEAMRLREAIFREWLASLADELNSSLPEYEVRLVHLDTADYLEFISQGAKTDGPDSD